MLVLLTVGGVPSIYAGDEQAFSGIKYERADGDAEIRPAFPAGPAELAADGLAGLPAAPGSDRAAAAASAGWPGPVTEVRHLANQALAYQAVDPDGGPGLTVLLNTSEAAVDFPLPGPPGKRLLASTPDDQGQAVPGRAARLGRPGAGRLTDDFPARRPSNRRRAVIARDEDAGQRQAGSRRRFRMEW